MTAYVLTGVLALAAPAPANPGVYARCQWQPAAALQVGEKHYIFRDGKQLADAMKLKGDAAPDTATAVLVQQFKVRDIDWKKQMIVTVAAGLTDADRLTVTRVGRQDQTLTIYYTLSVAQATKPSDTPLSAPQATGFGCPAETVLIERFDGAIKIQREEIKAPPKKD